MKTEKICKGTGIAIGHGCGQLVPVSRFSRPNRKYGLGMHPCKCFQKWMKDTPEGREYAAKQGIRNVRKQKELDKKQSNDRLNEMRIEAYGPDHRKELNKAVQLLSRKIDAALGHITCIDCDRPFGKQIDGGHYHSKGSNSSIAWNLHNLHSQRSECNQNGIGGGKQLGYFEGLIDRYGQEYADFVRYDIVRLYPAIKLSNREVWEKLQLVRGINRNFDTYVLPDCGIKARRMFNLIIGIYNE